jgi:ligand-binding sensor domain-containing protein
MNKIAQVILLLCLTRAFCFSQIQVIEDPYLKFSELSKNDGLSSNYILDFMQDSEGLMWIATVNGLNRYDGYSIKQYIHIPHDTVSLSDNLVTCLAELNDTLILVGTRSGLNYFDKKKETFSLKFYPLKEPAILAQKHIRALLQDDQNTWVETANGELHRLDTTGDVKLFKHDPPSMVNTYFYHSIVKDPNGQLLLGGRYMGLLKFNLKDETFTRISTNPNNTRKKRDDDAAVYFIDTEGTYWVGGIDGLYSFDPDDEVFTRHLSVSTFSITEPYKNELWIGTGNGLFRYQTDKKILYQSLHNDNLPNPISHNHINKLYIDHSGNIWIGTLDGVNIYQPSKNKFHHIYHIPENENSPVSNHVTAILADTRDRIWIGTQNNGLDCFNNQWQRLYHYSSRNASPWNLVSNSVSNLMEDSDHDIWVGQWSGRGFNILNPDRESNHSFNLMKNELKADWYNDMLEDADGQTWLGIWGAQGLYRFDKQVGAFMKERFVDLPGMLSNPIHTMIYDGDVIWLGFMGQNRFYCFDPVQEKFSFYSKNHYHPYPFNRIDSMVLEKGNLYYFTDNGTYLKSGNDTYDFEKSPAPKINKKRKSFFQKKSEIEAALGTTVYDIAEDDQENIWAATDKGLYRTSGNLPVARLHTKDGKSSGLLNDTLYSLVWQSPDVLWLGTAKGLIRFNTTEKTFRNYQSAPSKYLSSHLVKFLFQDSKGLIWIGTTENGLNCLSKHTGDITHYLSNPDDPDALWGSETSCMAEDRQGRLWIGAYGLNMLDPESKKFKHYTTAQGLADNNIMAILMDANEKLWISTANGLSCFDPEKEVFTNYYEKDGLQDNEFTAAACNLGNGMLAFGGKNGINIFNPGQLFINPNVPSIKLTTFKIFDEDHDEFLRHNEPIRLKYNQNYFSFGFSALDFSDPGQNTFQYKLENFDENWTSANAQNRIARYTNVDPGDYIFRVLAANNDGVWNETGLSIPLIIRPPFWKTKMFYGMVLASIILLVFLWVKYREKQIKEQNRYLVLEQKLLRSQMNPHFIFNSLSSIQSFIFENNPVVAGSYLSRFAELMRSILYNSREEFITLEKEIQTLNHYLELQQLRYNDQFKFELEIGPEIETETIKIPPMLAQPFIENAIEHGLKDLERQGLLKISFSLYSGMLVFCVEDNGIGVEEARRRNLNKAREHQSLATVITRERIDILNKGRRDRLYDMNITDRINEKGQQEGTVVTFHIPVD